MRLEFAERIEEAFTNVGYPGDDMIGAMELDDFIGQKEWKQVPLKTLLRNSSEIALFSPQAYHFYLPAFLCAVLRYEEADVMIEGVVDGLRPSPTPYLKSVVEWAIELFDPSQKKVVVEFLQRHAELFPHSSFVLLEEARAELVQAILFWLNS